MDLGVLKTEAFDWEAVYDETGVDYLYSRVSFVGRCVISGFALVGNGPMIGYRFSGSAPIPVTGSGTAAPQPNGVYNQASTVGNTVRAAPNNPVLPQLGTTAPGVGVQGRENARYRDVVRDNSAPAITHQTIRWRLQTPRSSLFIFRGPGAEVQNPPNADQLILESPIRGFQCDAKNGPFPKVFNVFESIGDVNLLMVDFAVETFVVETDKNLFNPSGILLSNRFSQTHVHDENYFTTVRTEGTAVFRTDMVYKIPQSPDSMRPVLFMPIPFGFQRKINFVRARGDGTGIEYSYDDQQVPTNFVAGPYAGATKISAVHRQAVISDVDILAGALGTYERVLGLKANRHIAEAENGLATRTATPPGAPPGGGGKPRGVSPRSRSRPVPRTPSTREP